MKLFTAVLLSCVAGLGFAQAAADDGYDACMAQSGGVTVAMLDCIGAASDRAQSAMDTLLAEHRPQLSSEQARALDAAQRDWHTYRQSTCNAAATLWGDGSFAAVVQADCWLELTQERLDWLQAVLAGRA